LLTLFSVGHQFECGRFWALLAASWALTVANGVIHPAKPATLAIFVTTLSSNRITLFMCIKTNSTHFFANGIEFNPSNSTDVI
jgi:hypothetical protein